MYVRWASLKIDIINGAADHERQRIVTNEFVSLASDGCTELWGALIAPTFPPTGSKKIPVIDYIYNGPFATWAPRTRYEAESGLSKGLAEAGFAVLMVDGRGTPERGKVFQDVVFRSFGVNEIPDHVAVLEKVCSAYPLLDRTRVGICGGSWGGYMVLRGMLLFSDVYKVGVATNPVCNLYDHPAMAIEPYMGLPENNVDGYLAASNIEHAGKLKGKLLVIHGTADRNAPFVGTMKMITALILQGKTFDFVPLADQGHSFSGPLRIKWLNLIIDYFREHL